MSLEQIELTNFRCIEHALLKLDSRCNVIAGANGSGKTSLLEAVFLLGAGRSFRVPRLEPLIRHEAKEFVVAGMLLDGAHRPIGLRVSAQHREIKLDGERPQSISDLALAFPVQVLDPGIHELIQGAPARRRRYLDWGVFHVEQDAYLQAWRRYRRALLQRNASLKATRGAPLGVWDSILIENGAIVAAFRKSYIESLSLYVSEIGRLLLCSDIQLSISQGWPAGMELPDAFEHVQNRDREKATTSVGPHHAELRIRVNGKDARSEISRGQQKLLAATLVLAQLAHHRKFGKHTACLLVDDPAAELDRDSVQRLVGALVATSAQLIITCLDPHISTTLSPGRTFHVEHGKVREMA